jgi:hypothetical protein
MFASTVQGQAFVNMSEAKWRLLCYLSLKDVDRTPHLFGFLSHSASVKTIEKEN